MRRVCPVQLHISRLQGRRGVSSRSRPKWARSIHSQHASFAQGADRSRMLPSCSGLSVTECGGESEDGVLRRNELEESQATSCVPLRCGAGCRVSLQLSPEAQECRTTWHQNTTLPRTDIRRHIDAHIHCSSTVATSHLSRLQDWHVYLIKVVPVLFHISAEALSVPYGQPGTFTVTEHDGKMIRGGIGCACLDVGTCSSQCDAVQSPAKQNPRTSNRTYIWHLSRSLQRRIDVCSPHLSLPTFSVILLFFKLVPPAHSAAPDSLADIRFLTDRRM